MKTKLTLIVAAFIMAGMAFLAVLTGTVEIVILVILMLAFFVAGILLNFSVSKKIQVKVNIVETGNKEEGILAEFHVANNSMIPVFKGTIRISAENMIFALQEKITESFSVRAKGENTVRLHIKSSYCGKYRIAVEDIRCMDIWGLTGISVHEGTEDYAYIFPDKMSIGSVAEAIMQNYEKERKFSGRKSPVLSDILQYREYEKGDSLKNVNWKLSVKHDQLLVREFDTPIDNQMLVIFDVNRGDTAYQNLTYSVMFSICATCVQRHMSYQICWPEGDQLQYAYIEAMEDLLQTMRKILSAPIMEDLPAAGLFETQDRKEKYAKILYITNSLNQAIEQRIRIWGNADIVPVNKTHFSSENIQAEMKRLAV